MPYSIELVEEIIQIKGNGLYDFHDAGASQDDALELIEEHGVAKVLVDITEIENEFQFDEIIQIIKRVPERFPTEIKHAVIFSEKTLKELNAHFSDNFSFNRGINVRVFAKEENAIKWLNEG